MEIFPVKSRSENCHISISFGRKKLLVSVSVLAETNIENIGDYWYWPKWIKKAFRSYPTQKSICHNKNIFSGAIHRLVGCLLGTGLNNLMVNTYSVFTTNSCMHIVLFAISKNRQARLFAKLLHHWLPSFGSAQAVIVFMFSFIIPNRSAWRIFYWKPHDIHPTSETRRVRLEGLGPYG